MIVSSSAHAKARRDVNPDLVSRVISATVFSDRALVTRLTESTVSAGEYTLTIPDLPTMLIDQSVRVSGEGTAEAKILEVKVETAFLDTIPQERVRQLQAKLQGLQDEMRILNDRASVLNQQKDFIGQIKIASADNIGKDLKVQRPTVEDWQKVLAFFDSNLMKIHQELRDVDKKRDEFQHKITAVQNEINQTTGRTSRSTKRILVSVKVSKGGTMRLVVSYVITGASWHPLYDARIASEQKSVEVTYYGMVKQSTGEDWENIDLTLSTAQPAIAGTQPRLYPQFVNLYQQPVLQRREVGAVMEREAKAPGAGAQREMPAPAQVEVSAARPLEISTATVETRPTSAVFNIQARSTIPSDNMPHKVTIAIEKLDAEFEYSTVPKLVPKVYLQATVTNTTDYPLLAGGMNVFFEGDYVSTSYIPLRSPTEKFDLYLGVDEGIKVERKLINKLTEYTGTFTKSTKVTYEFQIKVENYKKVRENIVVQDQIPISQNEKIVVEVEEPKEGTVEKDNQGILKWHLQLNPGEKRELKLKYSVEYPRDMQVVGLE